MYEHEDRRPTTCRGSAQQPKPVVPAASPQRAAGDAHDSARVSSNDGLSRTLRAAVSRRADRRVLQRYQLLTATAAVAPAAGEYLVLSGLQEFEAQELRPVVGTVPLQHTISAAVGGGANPMLRVSEDGHMALEHSNLGVRQPKVLYASQAVWQAANVALALVGSDYKLYADRPGALDVHLADGTRRTLDRVLPKTSAKPATGGPRPASSKGLTMEAAADCVEFAGAVMKHAGTDRASRLTIAPTGKKDYSEFRSASAMTTWVQTREWLLTKPWGATLWSTMNDERSEAQKAFQTAMPGTTLGDSGAMRTIGAAYFTLLQTKPALANQAAQDLGLNLHALPNVGEAYETYRIANDNALPRGDFVRYFWGQHIAAVIAQSGGDRVTLENYARTHEIGEKRTGPDYYFQMYGSGPGQTWHEAWTAPTATGAPVGLVAAGGADALTSVVRAR